MTMQTSGQISIGQVRNECQLSGQINAGNGTMSHLAGVGSGQQLAWSYWYGKTYVPPINNAQFAQFAAHVDRDFYLNINFRTGATSWSASGDNGPKLNFYTQYYPTVTMAQYYKSWSASIQYIAGSNMGYSISQQPAPSNDYTAIIHLDDNPAGGAHDAQYAIYITFGN